MDNKIYSVKNPEETQYLAKNFAKNLKGGEVLCLYGKLGSGKTTFIQGLAKGLGIDKKVISPTFVLLKEYDLGKDKKFYHLDLYRMENIEKIDIESLGLPGIWNNDNHIAAIEWAEKIIDFLPEKRIDIHIENQGDNMRKITIKTQNSKFKSQNHD